MLPRAEGQATSVLAVAPDAPSGWRRGGGASWDCVGWCGRAGGRVVAGEAGLPHSSLQPNLTSETRQQKLCTPFSFTAAIQRIITGQAGGPEQRSRAGRNHFIASLTITFPYH